MPQRVAALGIVVSGGTGAGNSASWEAMAARSQSLSHARGAHPVFGHLLRFRNDRIGMQLQLAQEPAELAHVRLGFVRTLWTHSPAISGEVLSSKSDAFVKSPGVAIFLKPVLGQGLLSSEGSFHAKQRKLIAPAFAHKRVAAYAATMADRAEAFAGGVVDGEVLDIAEGMMRLTLEIVGKALFDAEVSSDAADVGESVSSAMKLVMGQLVSLVPIPPNVPTPRNRKIRSAVDKLDAVIFRLVAQRRQEGGDRGDLLSILLESKDEHGRGMSDQQVRDEAMTLFLAGHETTANALTWTLYLLAKNPEVRGRVEAELDAYAGPLTYEALAKLPLVLAVLKEAMRLYPPVYLLARRAIAPVTLGGQPVRPNTLVFVNILGMHRNPRYFPDPDAFVPDRFLGDAEKKLPRNAYLPFGGGPRICIGNHFALMEGHVLLATLLRRHRFHLLDDAAVALEPLITLRPLGGLRLRAEKRR